MKKYIFKTIALTLAVCVTLSATSFANTVKVTLNDKSTQQATPIDLYVNGQKLENLETPAVIYNKHTLVPAREVFEALGATVEWVPISKEVFVSYNNQLVALKIDKITAKVNGKSVEMSLPPKIINGKTMIPLRFVSESLGFNIQWDEQAKIAKVDNHAPQPDFGEGAGILPATRDNTKPPVTVPLPDKEQPSITTPLPGENQPSVTVPLPDKKPSPTPNATPVPNQKEDGSVKENTAPTPSQRPKTTPQTPSTADPKSKGLSKDVSSVKIVRVDSTTAKITSITLPENNGAEIFVINASSPITSVSKTLLEDNRLILDIHNSENAISGTETNVNSSYVSKIRSAQNQMELEKVTRIVLDLNGSVEYSVSLSKDRKALSISFEKNSVTDIAFKTDKTADYVVMDFTATPHVNVFPLTNPDRIVIDAFDIDMKKIISQKVSGKFVSNIVSSQHDHMTGRVVVSVNGLVSMSVNTNGNQVIIKVSEPTFKNIGYDSNDNTLIIKKDGTRPINLSTLVQTDSYSQLKYIINLGGDYSEALGYGTYLVGDDYIKSITIQNNKANQTELIFDENKILAYNITEDNNYIYIDGVLPKEKYPRIVILDAGHGGNDPGATSQFGVKEKDIAFQILSRLIEIIDKEGYVKVYSTRTTDVKISLEERVAFANINGDLYISIHCNSSDKNTKAVGTETHYYPHENDSTIGIYTKELADIMQRNLLSSMGSFDRKTHKSPFLVIKYTKIPSILVETGFLSNSQEAQKLASPEYQQKIAEGIYSGILEVFKVYTPKR